MTQQPDDEPRRDPFSAWQSIRDSSLETWSRMLRQFFTSEEYTQAASAALETYLITSAPLRQHLETLMAEFVGSEAFARATQAQLDAYMTTSAPFRDLMLQVVDSAAFAQTTRELLDTYMTTSAPFRDLMLQFVKSEGFAQATRELLDTYMTTSAPFREALQTTLIQTFSQLNTVPGFDLARLAGPFDPTGMWRAMGDASIETWSRLLTGETFRAALATTMGQALTQLNMPTHTDVADLATRMDRLERRMDDVVRLLEQERGR